MFCSITTTAGSKGTGHLAHIPTGRTPGIRTISQLFILCSSIVVFCYCILIFLWLDNKSRQQHLQQQAILGNGAYNYGSGAKHVGKKHLALCAVFPSHRNKLTGV